MKKLGVVLLLVLVLLQAGTAFAEKHTLHKSWWNASKQMEVYMESIAIASKAVDQTVSTVVNENTEKVRTHYKTVTENASKEITNQKEAHITQLEDSKESIVASDMFQDYHDEKQIELNEELEAEAKAIIKSLLTEIK